MEILIAACLAFAQGEDEAARAKIAEFNKARAAAKSDEELVAALEELAKISHSRVLKELKEFLKGQSDAVKTAAARLIGGGYAGDKAAADALALVLPVEAARAKRDEAGVDSGHEVAAALLRALAKVGHKPSAEKTHSVFESPNLLLAREAIDAAGELRSLDSVEPLIRLLIEVEQGKQMAEAPRTNTVKTPPGSTPGMTRLPGRGNSPPLPPADDKASKEALKRHELLEPGLQNALKRITGEADDRPGKEWSAWWSKNRAKLRDKDR